MIVPEILLAKNEQRPVVKHSSKNLSTIIKLQNDKLVDKLQAKLQAQILAAEQLKYEQSLIAERRKSFSNTSNPA